MITSERINSKQHFLFNLEHHMSMTVIAYKTNQFTQIHYRKTTREFQKNKHFILSFSKTGVRMSGIMHHIYAPWLLWNLNAAWREPCSKHATSKSEKPFFLKNTPNQFYSMHFRVLSSSLLSMWGSFALFFCAPPLKSTP